MLLAGDIGGTNTRLALLDESLRVQAERRYASRDHAGLCEILADFLAQTHARADAASFGIAGPVIDGRCKTTNLPWMVDARELARTLGLPRAGLINDVEANGWGVPALGDADLVTLQEGVPGAVGNRALIAAGTGLGEAGLYWDGAHHRPFATEGGHATFAPSDGLERELHAWLATQHETVSWERVVSGPGLHALYRFVRDTGRGDEPSWLAEDLRSGDPSAVIAKAALDGRSVACERALSLFCVLYGAEAGNLALKMLAVGGVLVGGGIAPRIIAALKRGGFVKAFVSKGRMRSLLEGMSVRVIMTDRTALLGAARHALLVGGG
jgi:glucokinase